MQCVDHSVADTERVRALERRRLKDQETRATLGCKSDRPYLRKQKKIDIDYCY